MPIVGIDAAKNLGALIFHAGTAKIDGQLVTSGGRVLGVTAIDNDIKSAIDKVYRYVAEIHFENMHYRRDIAARALKA